MHCLPEEGIERSCPAQVNRHCIPTQVNGSCTSISATAITKPFVCARIVVEMGSHLCRPKVSKRQV